MSWRDCVSDDKQVAFSILVALGIYIVFDDVWFNLEADMRHANSTDDHLVGHCQHRGLRGLCVTLVSFASIVGVGCRQPESSCTFMST